MQNVIVQEMPGHTYLHVHTLDDDTVKIVDGELVIKFSGESAGTIIPADRFAETELPKGVYTEKNLRPNFTTAINLMSEREVSFDEDSSSTWAVLYGYCEENNLLSQLFSKRKDGTWEEFYSDKLRYGSKTINCGDWSAILKPSERAKEHLYKTAKLEDEYVTIEIAHQDLKGRWVYFVSDGKFSKWVGYTKLTDFCL
jgi:hypothetical protein